MASPLNPREVRDQGNEKNRERGRDRGSRATPNHATPHTDGRPKEPLGNRYSGRKRSRSPRDEGRQDDYKRPRSRSPVRRDNRGRDGRDGRDSKRRDNDRTADRARSPPKGPRGDRGPPRRPGGKGTAKEPVKAERDEPKETVKKDVDMAGTDDKPDDMDEDTWIMMKTMGFRGFKSTKDTKVPGNDKNWAVCKDKKVEARQYMNRKGGFNRPLSPSRT
ncbi:hypothetical protein EJ04DRAFT_477501 [Polyplosphaeria fusca]|uniref:U4/U6.U5 small nuclear ribonucleoprotein 27kDa protein domain-containing protein n=1 Tax=Polyplosphaeria fusca TaxID=682080 RepID=A0A9P4QL67_9PLEO|nr:hypothetical protein EJ04DRAFT_477501 [Polyplosphaeria fusca]